MTIVKALSNFLGFTLAFAYPYSILLWIRLNRFLLADFPLYNCSKGDFSLFLFFFLYKIRLNNMVLENYGFDHGLFSRNT